MRYTLRLREAQDRKERPELGTYLWGEEDNGRVILTAPAQLMEWGLIRLGEGRGK